jgi:hypothetical protein
MDSYSFGYMLGALFGMRAAEEGHLTLLQAHGAFEGASRKWLLLAAAPTQDRTVNRC